MGSREHRWSREHRGSRDHRFGNTGQLWLGYYIGHVVTWNTRHDMGYVMGVT